MNVVEWLARAIAGRPVPPPPDAAVPPDVAIRSSALVTTIGGRLSGMKGPAAAVTLGRTILIRPGVVLTSRLLRHELEHVRQWRARPYSFPFRYIRAHIRHGYTDNPYERAAREAEAGAGSPAEANPGNAGGHT